MSRDRSGMRSARCGIRKGELNMPAFMDALADEHFVILGGPLRYSKHRALLILDAPNEIVLRKRLAEDPWMRTGVLHTIEMYP
jgi:hypothetical protein